MRTRYTIFFTNKKRENTTSSKWIVLEMLIVKNNFIVMKYGNETHRLRGFSMWIQILGLTTQVIAKQPQILTSVYVYTYRKSQNCLQFSQSQ